MVQFAFVIKNLYILVFFAWVKMGMNKQNTPLVGIVMGSATDAPTMRHAAEMLEALGVPFEMKVVSAHRTPERMVTYAKEAESRGIQVIIAGAGGAAHLPGMVASLTTLPVLGVPVQSRALDGMDSLLSIVQMPKGVPVGTLAIGESGAANAALLAASMLANTHSAIKAAVKAYRREQTESVPDVP
jgi:5-(carboxyamino)imidazole ribonucleotide mutase